MSDLTKLGEITFKSPLQLEGSWGERELGEHESTMVFYFWPSSGRTEIEWVIEAIDTVEHIGLWFDEQKSLIDYDGIMGYLPLQAADLIESCGYKVDRSEFCGLEAE